MAMFYILHEQEKWLYVIEGCNQPIETGDTISIASLYGDERERLQPVGEVDIVALNTKIREVAGGGFYLHETPLSNIFNYRDATRIIFGKDGRIYTFRKPEDILKLRFVPVRLGYFFKDITPEILRAWEEHQAVCRAEAMITTDPEVWRQAYRDIRSCMQNKVEVEFYIENPHAFEIGVLIDKESNRVFARAVIYKADNGRRYYTSVYSDRPYGKLLNLFEKEGIENAPWGNYKLPVVKASSEIGIPYLDAFQYAKVLDIERNGHEKVWHIILKNTDLDYDFYARFTHDTQDMLYHETYCEGCNLYFPPDYLYGGYCESCNDGYEERCVNCGAYEIYENELCYECYRDEYIHYCESCNNEYHRDDIREVRYISFWDDNPDEREVSIRNVCYYCIEGTRYQNIPNEEFTVNDLWRNDNLAIITVNEEETFVCSVWDIDNFIDRLLQRTTECHLCKQTLEKRLLRRVYFGRFDAREGCYIQEFDCLACLSCINGFVLHQRVNRDLIAISNLTIRGCWIDNGLAFIRSELHNNQIFAVPQLRIQDFVGELRRQFQQKQSVDNCQPDPLSYSGSYTQI